MGLHMRIRNEHPADVEQICRIHYAAFTNHPVPNPGAEPTEHLISSLKNSPFLDVTPKDC